MFSNIYVTVLLRLCMGTVLQIFVVPQQPSTRGPGASAHCIIGYFGIKSVITNIRPVKPAIPVSGGDVR